MSDMKNGLEEKRLRRSGGVELRLSKWGSRFTSFQSSTLFLAASLNLVLVHLAESRVCLRSAADLRLVLFRNLQVTKLTRNKLT